jgi:sodium transport system permease protein
MLSSEEVVLGFAPEPLLGRTPGGRRRAAYLGMALTVLIYFYVGTLLQTWKPVAGLAISLWLLLPVLGGLALWLAWPGGRLAELLSLRGTGGRALAGALLLGAGSVVPIQQGMFKIQELFIPVPQDFSAGLEDMLGGMPTGLLLFLAALSPAICEELVFRGGFLGMLRRTGTTRSAVLVSSIFFGLIHLSVFRFLPTFILGLIMAVLTVRCRSILPAVVFHLIYNGLSVIQLKVGEAVRTAAEGPAAWVLSALALVAGALLLGRSRRQS